MLAFAASFDPSRSLEAERARWFVWLPVVFGLGIVIYFRLPFEPATSLALALPVMAIGLRLAAGDGYWRPLIAILLVTLTLGLAVAKVRTEWTRAPVLDHKLNAAEIRGAVELVEPRPGRGQRLTIRVNEIRGHPPERTPKRIRVRAMTARQGLKPGDEIRIKATLAPPSAPPLPGGYDFGRAAWYQGLGATGYSLKAPEIEGVAEQSLRGSLLSSLEALRQGIGDRITAAIPGEVGEIATSLITGERGGISNETNDAFRDSGLLHILSISGLHMVVMAGAVFTGLRVVLAMFPSVALRYPIKKWAAAAALVAAYAYLLLSGSSVATVRAFLMIAIMLFAVMVDRPALAMRNVAWSALLILAVFPESVLDAGFQMSFAAVVSLIAAYEAIRDRTRDSDPDEPGMARRLALFLGGIVLSTVIASISVAPFAAFHFHRSQQYALIANLIAIPICNLVVMPAGLLTLVLMPFGLESLPLAIMGWGIEAVLWTARWVASLPGAVVHIPAIPTAAFGSMCAGGLWLTLWRTRWRALGLVPIAAGIALGTQIERPAILAGLDGELVAVRQQDGTLAVLAARKFEFELARWLEHDGDARTPSRARDERAFRCDGAGCALRQPMAGNLQVAVARSAAALADDCTRATILIATLPVPDGCQGPRLIIDYPALRREGVHAIYLDADAGRHPADRRDVIERQVLNDRLLIRVETVRSVRGLRPWSMPPEPRLHTATEPALVHPASTITRRPQNDGPPTAPPRDDAEDIPEPDVDQ